MKPKTSNFWYSKEEILDNIETIAWMLAYILMYTSFWQHIQYYSQGGI